MSKPLKIVAVASSEETRARLLAQLQSLDFVEFNGIYIELSDAAQLCQRTMPDIIIVDTTGRELDAGLFIQTIGMNPDALSMIIALHQDMNIEVFKETIRQGAKEFIQYPEDAHGLEVALRQHRALLEHMASKADSTRQGATSHLASDHPPGTPGKIIAVFAAKGGVGCSTLAVNLAYELQHHHGLSTVFFDLDQVFCNTGMMLNHKPGHSLGDIADTNPHDVDMALIHKIVTPHAASGLHVVVSSKNVLDDNDMISAELMDVLLTDLTNRYQYVVVDLPTHVLDPYHQYMVERADELLLVSQPDLPSLYRTRQYLDLAQKYLDMRKIKMVLNRANMKAAYRMSNQDVENEFRYDIYARIPNDWDLNVEANSLGQMISQVNPRADWVKALRQLSDRLTGASATGTGHSADAGASATGTGHSADAAHSTTPTANGPGKGLLSKLFPPKSASSQPQPGKS